VIDKDKVKTFWDARAEKYKRLAFESIANLEQDPDNLQLKVSIETEKVFSWLSNIGGKSVLDLGAGVGQWSFRFADRGARRVLAVEYSEQLAEIGRAESIARGVKTVEFVVTPAEKLKCRERFDIVFISGLFVYMNDDQVAALMAKLPGWCTPGAAIVLRDGTGLGHRHEINDKYSAHLETQYSATYRTREEYIELFETAGFRLVKDENMFDEGSPLNKYAETRLHLFLFALRS
jgi:SAM-dependent methyltransferase